MKRKIKIVKAAVCPCLEEINWDIIKRLVDKHLADRASRIWFVNKLKKEIGTYDPYGQYFENELEWAELIAIMEEAGMVKIVNEYVIKLQ